MRELLYKLNQLIRKILIALIPNGFILKTKISNGVYVCGRNLPGYGGRGIYIYGDSIEPEFEHLEEFLDPKGVLIDVGANSGMYSIKAAKYFLEGNGKVLAIEPIPDMISILYYNLKLNNLSNIHIRNFCAGSEIGSANFWQNYNKPNTYSLIKKDPNAVPFSVIVIPLDLLAEWENLDRVDYIKIDVEGSELEVLRGSENIIKKYRPIIQVEVADADVHLNLNNYSIFRAPKSLNKIYIPNESAKINIPGNLGWQKLSE